MELRQIVDLAPQFIAVFGPHLERLYANRMSLDYFGRTLDEWRDTQPAPSAIPMMRNDAVLTGIALWHVLLHLKSKCGSAGMMESIVGRSLAPLDSGSSDPFRLKVVSNAARSRC
jgi:PAS domain-containing protein